MLARELIKELERRIAENEPHKHMCGELEIYIDQFSINGDTIKYDGAASDVRLTYDGTCTLLILTAWAPGTK